MRTQRCVRCWHGIHDARSSVPRNGVRLANSWPIGREYSLNVDSEALRAELVLVRKGRGCRRSDVVRHLGPLIKEISQITASDSATAARHKLTTAVQALLHDESAPVQLAVLAALALHPEANQRLLGAREQWLASQLDRSVRVARRRVDEAFDALVQRAVERADRGQDLGTERRWRVQSIRAVMNLAGAAPELTEHRVVRFLVDGVDEIVTRFSLPRHSPCSSGSHELGCEVLFGGRIRDVERPSDVHWRYVIELPRTFHRNETCEYGIRFRIPMAQAMAPHYALVPLLTVESLDLTVRFDPRRLPRRMWRFDGVPPRMIDSPGPPDPAFLPDRLGEVTVRFAALREGLGYGVRWEPASTPEEPS